MEYKKYTEEEIKKARNVNLIDFLFSKGYNLTRKGRNYFLKEHDSLCFFQNNTWYWYSQGIGGNPIDFFTKGPFEKLSFSKAVNFLLENSGYVNNQNIYQTKKEEKNQRKTFEIPQAHINCKRVMAYLCQKRKLDYGLVKFCINKGMIFETAKTHNCAFVGKDNKGEIKHIFLRGTTDKKFALDVDASDKSYGFKLDFTKPEEKNKLFVFESAIDVLSYLTLEKLKGKSLSGIYISLSGVSLMALDKIMLNADIKEIFVCTDNDKYGKLCYEKIVDKYSENVDVIYSLPVYKDFNEDLIKFCNKEQI